MMIGLIMAKNDLKIGDKAPDFTLLDQDSNEHTLSDYFGKKLVVYFYPKDDTPGCTTEACNFRDSDLLEFVSLRQKRHYPGPSPDLLQNYPDHRSGPHTC